MTESRRTGREPEPCLWFALCEETTDIELKHVVLGWTTCCERCLSVIGHEPPLECGGWRVRATFMEHGWERTKTQAFYNPLHEKCLDNIRRNIELWHPHAEDLQLEVIGMVRSGWGDAPFWSEAFKREDA